MRRLLLLLVIPAGGVFGQCLASAKLPDPASTPSWNGWGPDASNARFQPAQAAQIPAAQVSRLKLKWAFGFPSAKSVLGQPSVTGGRVYIGVDTGMVYSLNAASGCMYWFYKADAGVRTAVTIAPLGERFAAYFGDLKANVYAIDAATGELLWKAHAEDHPSARITGAPKVFEKRIYVPVASGEEGGGGNANYACCTFRGSVVALDAASGRQIWKTYTIADERQANRKELERRAALGSCRRRRVELADHRC